MNWTQLMSAIQADGATAALDIPESWLQGRTAFGGLTAALALRAMRLIVPGVKLRTLQATFLAPVPAGRATAQARLLRAGKSASHVEARVMDGDNVAALVVGVFGAARESAVKVAPVVPALKPNPRAVPFGYVPNLVPAFTQNFEAKWLQGLPPFTGDTATEHVLEVSMRDPGPCTESHVLALADFVPPVALSLLKAPAPGATLTWMLEMIGDFDGAPVGGWRVDAALVAGRDGYTSQSVMLWAPGGRPVALSRQSMVVFG